MARPGRVCPDCLTVHTGKGRCPSCTTLADRARGTPAQRGYGQQHRTRFRPGVLAKHPTCAWPDGCTARSTIADHWPYSRRELVALGMDPDDPANGRGLCKPHHDRSTAEHQPGGWADRR